MKPDQVIEISVTISRNVLNEMTGEQLKFNFALVENIFAENSKQLASDLLWVFSISDSSTRVKRMLLCLKHHGTEFNRKCTDKDTQMVYALHVVRRLAQYYDA